MAGIDEGETYFGAFGTYPVAQRRGQFAADEFETIGSFPSGDLGFGSELVNDFGEVETNDTAIDGIQFQELDEEARGDGAIDADFENDFWTCEKDEVPEEALFYGTQRGFGFDEGRKTKRS
jgi:hypothetical protein